MVSIVSIESLPIIHSLTIKLQAVVYEALMYLYNLLPIGTHSHMSSKSTNLNPCSHSNISPGEARLSNWRGLASVLYEQRTENTYVYVGMMSASWLERKHNV